tara:strand:+ start:214 stop:561 length:348 start_codon:yes stop_codon:yes gene_type:complete
MNEGDVEFLKYVASYDDLCNLCNAHKPAGKEPIELVDFTLSLRNTFPINRPVTFDPYCYIAGYPEARIQFLNPDGTLNETLATVTWIYFGYNIKLSRNLKEVNNEEAKHILKLCD